MSSLLALLVCAILRVDNLRLPIRRRLLDVVRVRLGFGAVPSEPFNANASIVRVSADARLRLFLTIPSAKPF